MSRRSQLTPPRLAGRLVAALAVIVALVVGTHGGPPAEPGKLAPDLTLQDLDGKTFRVAELRGRVVHLAFVAVWCDPCRKEASRLADLWLRHRRQGYTLLLVGVPARQDARRLRAWAKQAELGELPVCYDKDGSASAAFGAELLPHHVLIDREGRVDRVDDRLTGKLEARVAALLAARPRG